MNSVFFHFRSYFVLKLDSDVAVSHTHQPNGIGGPKTIKMNFIAIKDSNFSFWVVIKFELYGDVVLPL